MLQDNRNPIRYIFSYRLSNRFCGSGFWALVFRRPEKYSFSNTVIWKIQSVGIPVAPTSLVTCSSWHCDREMLNPRISCSFFRNLLFRDLTGQKIFVKGIYKKDRSPFSSRSWSDIPWNSFRCCSFSRIGLWKIIWKSHSWNKSGGFWSGAVTGSGPLLWPDNW